MSQLYYEKGRLWPSRRDKHNDDPQVASIQQHEGLEECHDAPKKTVSFEAKKTYK